MVRQLIERILKRKRDESKQAKEENIPDVLPPLGEDASQPAELGNLSQSGEVDNEPPDELPVLARKKPEVAESRPGPEFRHSPHREVVVRHEPGELHELEDRATSEESDSFFANLTKMLKEGKPVDAVVANDLLGSMKESWGIRRDSAKLGPSSVEEKRINAEISEVLAQLRLVEGRWKSHKAALEEYERLAREEEEKIREKERELKALLKKSRLYQRVPDGRIVMLKGSVPIRNLNELINALRAMDAATFKVHVTKRKNPFSELAGSVDRKLGEDLKKAASKDGMLKVLGAFVKKLSE